MLGREGKEEVREKGERRVKAEMSIDGGIKSRRHRDVCVHAAADDGNTQ